MEEEPTVSQTLRQLLSPLIELFNLQFSLPTDLTGILRPSLKGQFFTGLKEGFAKILCLLII